MKDIFPNNRKYGSGVWSPLSALMFIVAMCCMSCVAGQDSCNVHANCKACFAATGCGWCVTDGVCLSGTRTGPAATGPGCRGHTTTNQNKYWYFAGSQIIRTVAAFPVNPAETHVYLHPGEPLVVPVQVTVPLPTDQDLDVFFLQDTSGSMADDINTFRTLATELMNELLTLSKTVKVGLGSFIEKPCSPQGFGRDDDRYLLADNTPRNYVWRLEQPLDFSSLALQTALFKLEATSNIDFPEAAFDAISQALSCSNVGWRPQARQILIVTTDAKFHYGGETRASCTKGKPGWVSGQCYGVLPGRKYTREDTDYPTKQQIAQLFRETNVIPVFAIAHNSKDPQSTVKGSNNEDQQWEIDAWRNFQENEIKFGATLPLSDDSSNLIPLIVQALKDVSSIVSLQLLTGGDPRAPSCQISNAVTGCQGSAVKNIFKEGTTFGEAKYLQVKPGETKPFDVHLLNPGVPLDYVITLTSPGFGISKIQVYAEFPCNDCLGLAGGMAKWDLCGDCNGQNECVGCDGAPFSLKAYDQCGDCGGSNACKKTCPPQKPADECNVCGGNNLCRGCDGVAHSGAVLDDCGVCNGRNECYGCDGQKAAPGMKPKKNDRCGVCGGSDECVGCDGRVSSPAGKLVYDACGVCGGQNECKCDVNDDNKVADECGNCVVPTDLVFNSCLGCDGLRDSGKVYDDCGVCDGFNECVSPCDGLPWGTPLDACGVCNGDGSSCASVGLNITRPDKTVLQQDRNISAATASIIGVAVGVPVTALLCAALVAAFFVYKKHQNPYWMVPSGLLDDQNTGIADLNLVRSNPELVKESQRRRFESPDVVDEVLRLDDIAKQKEFEFNQASADYNKLKEQNAKDNIKMRGLMKSDPNNAEIATLKETIAQTSKKMKETDLKRQSSKEEAKVSFDEMRKELLKIGNLVHDSVPVSQKEEEGNRVERFWGEPRREAKLFHHDELFDMLDGLETSRGVGVAGHRAYFLQGVGVFLNLALIQYGLDFLSKRGFTALQTPFFMKREVLGKTCQLADNEGRQFDDDMYTIPMTGESEDNDLTLIATSEQPVSAFHQKEWLEKSELPKKYAGYSTCFRKESGAHGRDTWGIFRVHQFEKIEQFAITAPGEESWAMHEQMLKNAEDFLQSLELPYQVITIISKELNNATAKKYDVEAWFPTLALYRELVSCSNCTDYQARRLEIRYQGDTKEKAYVHMLNSTLCATQRTLCCIVENYQCEEGIRVPTVLQPYLGGKTLLPFVRNKPRFSHDMVMKNLGKANNKKGGNKKK